MIKFLLKNLVFTYISLLLAQSLVRGVVDLSGEANFMFLLALCAFFIVNAFYLPLYKILSLPYNFVAIFVLRLLINFLLLYLLPMMLASFNINPGYLAELNILGVVIPSTRLSLMPSVLAFAIVFVLSFSSFMWLSSSGKRR